MADRLNVPERWVVKSNELVEARYSHTLMAHRILMMAVEQISMHDKEFAEIRASLREYADLAGIRTNNLHDLAKAFKSDLLELQVEMPLRANDGSVTGWEALNVFSKARYVNGRGYLVVKLNNDLAPYLLQLKEQFTRYRLAGVFGVRSSTSVRIYELCKQRQGLGQRVIDLADLRTMFMMEDKYPRYRDFRRYVLEVATREINKKTDLRIAFEEVRIGRKVTAIRFNIRRAPVQQLQIPFDQRPGSAPEPDAFDLWYDALPEAQQTRYWAMAEEHVGEQPTEGVRQIEIWSWLRQRWKEGGLKPA